MKIVRTIAAIRVSTSNLAVATESSSALLWLLFLITLWLLLFWLLLLIIDLLRLVFPLFFLRLHCRFVTGTAPVACNVTTAAVGATCICFWAVLYTMIFATAQTFLSRSLTLVKEMPEILASEALSYFRFWNEIDYSEKSVVNSKSIAE